MWTVRRIGPNRSSCWSLRPSAVKLARGVPRRTGAGVLDSAMVMNLLSLTLYNLYARLHYGPPQSARCAAPPDTAAIIFYTPPARGV